MKIIERVRIEKGWTKAALARKAELQPNVIGWIETGRFIPYESQLKKIAFALDWQGDPNVLLEEVGE